MTTPTPQPTGYPDSRDGERKCPACAHFSRYYVPGECMNFCEHCGEPMDRLTDRWATQQAEKMMRGGTGKAKGAGDE